jgi:hypothetical protein
MPNFFVITGIAASALRTEATCFTMLQSMTVEPPMMSTFDPQNLGAQLMSTQNGEDFSLGEVRINPSVAEL